MLFSFSRNIGDPPAVYHGGREKLKHPKLINSELIDFSVSLNPFALPLPVQEAIAAADPSQYPDPDASELKKKLSVLTGNPENSLLILNGASQGIFLLALCFIETGDPVLILKPTYGEYEKNSLLFNGEVHSFESQPNEGFIPHLEKLTAAIQKVQPKLLWICNPGNPSGVLISQSSLFKMVENCAAFGGITVIDQSYLCFTADTFPPFPGENYFSHPAAVTLFSMTKAFSLAGLRLGFLVADPRIIKTLKKIQPEWSINSPALAAGKAAIENIKLYQTQWEIMLNETKRVEKEFRNLGICTIPSSCNILMAKRKPSSDGQLKEAAVFHKKMYENGVLVRDCSSFGYPDFFRIGIRTPEENNILLDILSKEEIWEN